MSGTRIAQRTEIPRAGGVAAPRLSAIRAGERGGDLSPAGSFLLSLVAAAATTLTWVLTLVLRASNVESTAVQDVAAAALVLLLPIAVGGVFRFRGGWSAPAEIGLRYVSGNVILLAVALVASWIGEFSVANLALPALVLAWAGPVIGAIGLLRSRRWDVQMVAPSLVLWAVAGAWIGFAAVVFWRSASPPPFQPSWDGLLHLTVAERMGDGVFSMLLSDFTDAFGVNAYLPGHHLRLAIASYLSGVGVLHVQWGAPFVFQVALALGVFAVANRIAGPGAAFVAAAATPFFQLLTKSPAVLTSFLPASEAVALTPLVLAPLVGRRDRTAWARAAALALLIVPIHAIHGVLLVAVLLVGAGLNAAVHRWNWKIVAGSLGVVAAMMLAFAADLTAMLPPDTLLDPTGAYAEFTPSAGLESRLRLVARFLPEPFVAISLLAATGWLLTRGPARTRLAAVTVSAALLFLIPLPGLERAHGILNVTLPMGLAFVAGLMAGFWRSLLARDSDAFHRFAAIAVPALVVLLAVPIVRRPLVNHLDRQLTDTDLVEVASSFADYEIEVFTAFRTELDPRRTAVSDPVTQSMLEAFAGLDTPGGPYLPEATRDALQMALTGTPDQATRALRSLTRLNGDTVYLALTGRTVWWATQGAPAENFVFRPRHLSLLPQGRVKVTKDDVIERLAETGCVESIDDRNEVVLFVVHCHDEA